MLQRVIRLWEQHTSSPHSPTRIGIIPWPIGLSKYLPILGLTITTGISSGLLYLIDRPAHLSDRLYGYIKDNRASVQVMLDIATGMLGFLHLYALTSAFNFTTRIKINKQATTLDRLKMWRALSFHRSDLGLPLRYLIPALLFSAFAFVPPTLWTGALTPVLSVRQMEVKIDVPHYAPDPEGNFWNQT